MADYSPLVMPTMPANADYTDTANFLADSAQAIVTSGNSFLQTLTALKDTDFSVVGNLLPLGNVVFTDLTQAEFRNRPVKPTLDLNVQDLLDQLHVLTVPGTMPTNTFSYTDPGYASTLRDPLINKLLVDLAQGGYGIETSDEIALYNRARDRESLTAQAAIEEAKRQAASTSFPMPQGSMFAAIERARQDALNKDSSVNRDIMLNRSKLYVENRQFIIEKVIATEGQSIELYNSIQNRRVEVAKLEVQLGIAVYALGLQYFQAQIDMLNKQILAQLDIAKIPIALYSAEISSYSAFVNAISAELSAAVKQTELGLEWAKADNRSRADIVRFKLQQLMATVENSKTINQYGTEFFRTSLGAAMNGISGLSVRTETA